MDAAATLLAIVRGEEPPSQALRIGLYVRADDFSVDGEYTGPPLEGSWSDVATGLLCVRESRSDRVEWALVVLATMDEGLRLRIPDGESSATARKVGEGLAEIVRRGEPGPKAEAAAQLLLDGSD